MATARFRPCPHCHAALSYLEGVSGSTMTPKCPRCHAEVTVSRATFLMADHSSLALKGKAPAPASKPS